MTEVSIMTANSEAAKHDWSRFDAMTPEQCHAAALGDPDAAARAHLVVNGRELEAVGGGGCGAPFRIADALWLIALWGRVA